MQTFDPNVFVEMYTLVFVGVFLNILMLVKYVNALVRVVYLAYDDDWRLPT